VLPLTQGALDTDLGPLPGLRSRKKERTRRAIEDAALDLFVEQGYEATTVDQIAERAEISKPTFFRYFASKGEVVFGDGSDEHAEIVAAIADLDLDPGADDLRAVITAMQEGWLPKLDPVRTARRTRAAGTSPLLRGLSLDTGLRWQAAVSEALARRRGLDAPDRRSRLVAAMAFAALNNAVNTWVDDGCVVELARVLDDELSLLGDVCAALHPPAEG
jgi:AcrR family transcriptional regulator